MGLITIGDFIAGWVGGISGVTVGHPLDTIKVRQQTYGTSMFVAVSQTFRYEGLRGFYKGALFPFLTVGPSNAIFFGTYGNVLHWLMHDQDNRSKSVSYKDLKHIGQICVAGCAAGCVQVMLNCPIEVIKTNLQARTHNKGSWKKHYQIPYTGSFQALRGILKEQGIKGLYRGFTPTFIRDVPTSGIYTVVFELILHAYYDKSASLPQQMLAGGMAGVLSWIPVVPIDVVKSRMQVEDPKDPQFKKFSTACVTLLKTRGAKVFIRGVTPLLLQAFIRNGAIIVGYETFLDWYQSM